MTYSPRRLFGSVMAAPLSKRKEMAVALLSDLSVVVKGKTGVTRPCEAPHLAGWARDTAESSGGGFAWL
jgi:hypothetical protein